MVRLSYVNKFDNRKWIIEKTFQLNQNLFSFNKKDTQKCPTPGDTVFEKNFQYLVTLFSVLTVPKSCSLAPLFFFLFIWHVLLKTAAFQNIKGTVIQIKKSLINDCLLVSKVSWKFRILIFYSYCSNLPVKFAIFLKSRPLFNSFHCLFSLWTRHCRS